ncbi:MAG: penicillin-binding protein activator [Rhodospirillaceae bacterium]
MAFASLPAKGLARRAAAALVAVGLAAALAGCADRTVSERPRTAQPAAEPPPRLSEAPLAPPPGAPPGMPAKPKETKVALLLPLSGNAAALGRSMQNAAQLALFDAADETLSLRFHDTGDTADGARVAAQRAVDDGAALILGPVFAGSVSAVTPVARGAGVNVVAFSNTRSVAGPGTYLLGLMPRQQVVRAVAYAAEQGARRFAALVPETAFGRQVAGDFRDAVASAGGAVAKVQFYPADQRDLADVLRRLTGATGQPPRGPVARPYDPVPSVAGRAAVAAAQAEADEPTPPPDPGFDALYLPEAGQRLLSIATLLPYYNVDPKTVRLLGMAAWQDPALGREPALAGGTFAAPDPAPIAEFQARYREAFGGAPDPLASLAYDATALAAVLANRLGGPDFSSAALTGPSGFAGASGLFRLLPTGEGERGLAVLAVQPTGFDVVDPAPQSFATVGQ